MSHRRSLQLHLPQDLWWRERRARSEDWQVLTTKALACLHHAAAAERHDGMASALHIASDTMHRPSMFSFSWCGRANGAERATRSSRRKDIPGKNIFRLQTNRARSRAETPSIALSTSVTRSEVTSVAGTAQSGVNGRLSSHDLDLLLPLLCRGLLRRRHREHVLLEACLDPFGIDTQNRMLLVSRQTAE